MMGSSVCVDLTRHGKNTHRPRRRGRKPNGGADKRDGHSSPKAAVAVFAQQRSAGCPAPGAPKADACLSRSPDLRLTGRHTVFSGLRPMTDFRRVCGLRAYSGGTVPEFDRILYSPPGPRRTGRHSGRYCFSSLIIGKRGDLSRCGEKTRSISRCIAPGRRI